MQHIAQAAIQALQPSQVAATMSGRVLPESQRALLPDVPTEIRGAIQAAVREQGRENIRTLAASDWTGFAVGMSAMLRRMVPAYFSAPNTGEETYMEFVEFVADQFKQLHPLEVEYAFKACAARKLVETVDGNEAVLEITAFHGHFNVSHLGRLLSAYVEYRRPAVAEAHRLANATPLPLRIGAFSPAARVEQIKRLPLGLNADTTKVTHGDYLLLHSIGAFDGWDKKPFFERATQQYLARIQNRLLSGEVAAGEAYELRKNTEAAGRHWSQWPDGMVDKVSSIAQILMVLEWAARNRVE